MGMVDPERVAGIAHPSSDLRFAPATFSLKGRRGIVGLPLQSPSRFDGEGTGVKGALLRVVRGLFDGSR